MASRNVLYAAMRAVRVTGILTGQKAVNRLTRREQMQFLIENSMNLLLLLIVAVYGYKFYYDMFAIKNMPDDWHEVLMFNILKRKYGLRHREFVGQKIAISTDKSVIKSDDKGNLWREFKE
jgi:hypothetical protein